MALTITLQPEYEAQFRVEAQRAGIPLEQWIAQRTLETELLWRIRLATLETETRTLHRLLRKQKTKPLTDEEQQKLQQIIDERELRGAQRLEDLIQLARLRGISVSVLMDQMGIRPILAL